MLSPSSLDELYRMNAATNIAKEAGVFKPPQAGPKIQGKNVDVDVIPGEC